MKTRMLSLFLALALLVTLLPMATLADGLGLQTAPKKCEHLSSKTVQEIVEPNCIVDGYIKDYKVCNDCGEAFNIKEYPLGKATGHDWENGVCLNCGAESPFQVKPVCQHEKTHTKQTVVEATCTEGGYIHHAEVCNECGEEVSATDYALSDAAGHKWADGVCTVCGEESPFQVAPKCTHEKTHTKQTIVEATCTEGGYIHHAEVCNECGEEVSATDYALSDAAGHKWADGVCTVCGEESPFQVAPKCTHEKTHTKQTIVEATCTEGGYIHHAEVCNECGEEVSATDYALSEAAGHKWADGICTVCGEESPFQVAPDNTPNEDTSDNVPSDDPAGDTPADDPSDDEPVEEEPAYPEDAWKYLSDLFRPWL